MRELGAVIGILENAAKEQPNRGIDPPSFCESTKNPPETMASPLSPFASAAAKLFEGIDMTVGDRPILKKVFTEVRTPWLVP